ncbi:MAG: hypothetical protein WDM81_19435 [Rhizomicrobium sp.]
MTQSVRIVGDSAGAEGIPLIPALIPPGYLIFQMWVLMSAHGWHLAIKLAACAAMIYAIFKGIGFTYQYLPPPLSIFLSIAYMAITYGWCVSALGADPIWTAAACVAAGVVGFFGGRLFSRDYKGHARRTAV